MAAESVMMPLASASSVRLAEAIRSRLGPPGGLSVLSGFCITGYLRVENSN